MFAGAGDFFRPVDLRKEVTPSAAVRPAARSGDEPQKRSGDEPQKHGGDEPQKRSGDEPQKHDGEPKKHSPEELQKHTIDALPDGEGAADPFSGDAVELSIAALFVMLAGRAPPRAEKSPAPPRAEKSPAPPRAEKSPAPPRAEKNPVPPRAESNFLPLPDVQEPHRAFGAYQRAASALPSTVPPQGTESSGARDAGGDIFYMLAALEKAGVQAVTVAGGQTIYAVLRAQCRAHDIALAVPAAPPDNTSW